MTPDKPPPATTEQRFGQWVRRTRIYNGYSQADLAQLLAGQGLVLDATAITRIERGSRGIKLNEAAALAQLFDATLDETVE